MKLGIIGAGALGLTFAAALSPVHDVIVLARRAATAELLQREGIAREVAGALDRVAVAATADPAELGDLDAVIVAVKAYATLAALAPLRGVLAPRTLVASVQNGLDAAAVARAALPGARVVAGSTTQGAIRLGEGRVQPVNCGTTQFAAGDGESPSAGDLVAAFLAAGLDARITDDAAAMLWRKLVVNAAINPLCALTATPNGAAASEGLAPLARALAAEAAAVARAEGSDLGDPWPAVEAAALASATNRNSMLQDLDAGRPTEIDAISGAIVERARRHGIAVPLTATMLAMVRAREGAPGADARE